MSERIEQGFAKAGTSGVDDIPNAEITIEGSIDPHLTLEECYSFFRDEAERLGLTLIRTLPQGTLWELLIYLLRHHTERLMGTHLPGLPESVRDREEWIVIRGLNMPLKDYFTNED